MKTKDKITKSDLKKVSLRWLLCSQICWNYEKMQGQGYLFSMLPILKKLYKGQEMKEMMENHNQFYNTNPYLGALILGANIAIEEKEGLESKDVVTGIKTGLMGSFGGVGDSFFILITTILGALSSYMAINGNYLGVILWILVNFIIITFRLKSIYLAYDKGVDLFSKMSDKLDALTNATTILGITVIGALIPTVVKVNLLFAYQKGDVFLSMQEILDYIMPALLPVSIVYLIYTLLGKKRVNSTKIIVVIILISILLYKLKILG